MLYTLQHIQQHDMNMNINQRLL